MYISLFTKCPITSMQNCPIHSLQIYRHIIINLSDTLLSIYRTHYYQFIAHIIVDLSHTSLSIYRIHYHQFIVYIVVDSSHAHTLKTPTGLCMKKDKIFTKEKVCTCSDRAMHLTKDKIFKKDKDLPPIRVEQSLIHRLVATVQQLQCSSQCSS